KRAATFYHQTPTITSSWGFVMLRLLYHFEQPYKRENAGLSKVYKGFVNLLQKPSILDEPLMTRMMGNVSKYFNYYIIKINAFILFDERLINIYERVDDIRIVKA